jgi:hypothetical protein
MARLVMWSFDLQTFLRAAWIDFILRRDTATIVFGHCPVMSNCTGEVLVLVKRFFVIFLL